MNKKIYTILILMGSLMIIFLCIVVFIKPAPFPWLDLSQSGEIGDTIGGIAAPIVGIIGAVLVYWSFQEQLEANRIQKLALNNEIQRSNATKDMDIFLRLYDQLEDSFQNLTYINKTGPNAVNAYIDNLQKDYHFQIGRDPGFENSLDHMIYMCILLFKRTLSINLPDTDDELSKQILIYFYKNRLAEFISSVISQNQEGTKSIYFTVFNLWDTLIEDAQNRGYEI